MEDSVKNTEVKSPSQSFIRSRKRVKPENSEEVSPSKISKVSSKESENTDTDIIIGSVTPMAQVSDDGEIVILSCQVNEDGNVEQRIGRDSENSTKVISKEKIVNKCSVCLTKCPGREALAKHKSTHKPRLITSKGRKVQVYVCDNCGETHSTKYKHIAHIKLEHNTNNSIKRYFCDKCDKAYATIVNLRSHINLRHPIQNLECVQCGEMFCEPIQLRDHIKTHEGNSLLECELCGRKLKSLSTKEKHMELHHKCKEIRCSICYKPFMKQGDLNQHMKTHVVQETYDCRVCDAKFQNESLLKKHLTNKHCDNLTEERP